MNEQTTTYSARTIFIFIIADCIFKIITLILFFFPAKEVLPLPPIIKDSMAYPEILLGTLFIILLASICLMSSILELKLCFKLIGIVFYFLSIVSFSMMLLVSTTFAFSTLVYAFSGRFFYWELAGQHGKMRE